MREVLAAEPRLSNAAPEGPFLETSARGITRFEARGRRLGHRVFDLCYKRI
jgi:tRNA (guanine-N7-)-methyltransferase